MRLCYAIRQSKAAGTGRASQLYAVAGFAGFPGAGVIFMSTSYIIARYDLRTHTVLDTYKLGRGGDGTNARQVGGHVPHSPMDTNWTP